MGPTCSNSFIATGTRGENKTGCPNSKHGGRTFVPNAQSGLVPVLDLYRISIATKLLITNIARIGAEKCFSVQSERIARAAPFYIVDFLLDVDQISALRQFGDSCVWAKATSTRL